MLFVVLVMIFVMQSVHVTAKTEESLTYESEDYLIKLTFDRKASIPKNAQLRVREICEGTKEFQQYFSKTEKFVQEDKKTEVTYARFFDVSIMDGDQIIEPDESVKVTISYKEGVQKEESHDISVIHFIENGEKELLEVKEEKENNLVTEISFQQESFSVIGMIVLDGVNTEVKSSLSEIITEVNEIQVKKEWSDGENLHENDLVKISLYRHEEEKEEKINEIILSGSNNWNGYFKNLDEKLKYSIKEEQVISGNMDVTATYKSNITNKYEKRWCTTENNSLLDGTKVLLFLDNNTKALRKSTDFDQMNLRTYNVKVENSDIYGTCCTTEITNNCVWISTWSEEKNAWNLYNEAGNAYLSLVYNPETCVYEWATSREIIEGSYLKFSDGIFSATVDGVTRYFGIINGKGPYEAVEKEDDGVTKFQVFEFKVFSPVVCEIYNEKNETTEEHEINVDVITEKTIDYLGDGNDNPDTDADNEKLTDKILRDLYRLDLSVQMKTDVTGLDLLMVIDVSSSMEDIKDAKDDEGNNIKRSEALRQALNKFIPEFLPEGTKNRVALVAFESETIILQNWTDSADEVLDKVNYEVDGQMPLYSGSGTNYEASLARAHEALAMRGYSNNAKAMLFLSDGDPTAYISGNDEQEAGNVTFYMGEASLSDNGIECIYPENLNAVRAVDGDASIIAADEAITSFHKHNPEIMVGTVAFNTKLTDSIKNLATDEDFVTKIENGSPTDLINAMELITEYVPEEIVITDELSENIEFYDRYPDVLVTECDESGNANVLYSTKTGLTENGRESLDNDKPVEIGERTVTLRFRPGYNVKNRYTYHISFNVNVSQKAMNEFADQKGTYPDQGDKDTDYKGNETSSLKDGFYSNQEGTKVTYSLSGAKVTKKYRKPVVQAREGTLTIWKTDISGNAITTGASFELYREADENETNVISVEGVDRLCVKVAEGTTDNEGKLVFEHLRLAVFDEGYPYYLLETKAPDGYVRIEKPMKILLTTEGNITVKNGVFADFTFAKINEEGEKLQGAQFELSILRCDENSHEHVGECFEMIEKKVSNPEIMFEKLSSEMTYCLKEVKAPDGYICPDGYWLIRVNENQEIEMEKVGNWPDVRVQEDGMYGIVNEKVLTIPVTGGDGIINYLIIGIVLITGGIFMKKRKSFSGMIKIFALVMASVQMFSITAFAIDKEEKGNITVNGVESNVTVNAYQMMDVNFDYEADQPKNPMYQWRKEVQEWMEDNYPEYIDTANENEVKEEFSNASDKTVAELYDKLAVAIKEGKVNLPMSSVTAAADTVSIGNLEMGNYFILIEGGVKVYRPLTANVVPEWKETEWVITSPVVEAKASAPVITKIISDSLDNDNLNIGDTISYEIVAVVPDYPVNAIAKKFVISDILSSGLTLMEDTVKVFGMNSGNEPVQLTEGYVKTTQRPSEAATDNNATFAYDFSYESISSYSSVKITYDAILNKDAEVSATGNPNTAYLDYNNNPYVESSWKTDDDVAVVYTYGLKIFKVDEETETGLAGAQFSLKRDGKEILFAGTDGNYHVAREGEEGTGIVTVSSTGNLILKGLDAAEYILTEEKAPEGYVKLQNPITIKIEDSDLNGKVEYNNMELEDGYISLTVENDKGFTLPVTGGMGSTVFGITGMAMICTGGVLIATYLRKKKKG